MFFIPNDISDNDLIILFQIMSRLYLLTNKSDLCVHLIISISNCFTQTNVILQYLYLLLRYSRSLMIKISLIT